MSVLLGLPDDVCKEIIRLWLSLDDIGKLDVSLSSPVDRGYFLPIVQEIREINPIMSDYAKVDFFRWVYARKLRLRGLELTEKFFHVDGTLLFPLEFTHIVQVNVNLESRKLSPFIIAVINRCNSLQKLHCKDLTVVQLQTMLLRRLQEFDIWNAQRDISLFDQLRHCRNLTVLKLNNVFTGCEEVYGCLFRRNPNLVHVSLCCEQKVLPMLTTHCPSIRVICLRCLNAVDPLLIRNVLQARPTVKCINIGSQYNGFSYDATADHTEVHLDILSQQFDANDFAALLDLIPDVRDFYYFTMEDPSLLLYPDAVLREWLIGCKPTLKSVELCFVSPSTIESLLRALPTIHLRLQDIECNVYPILLQCGKQLKGLSLSCDWMSFEQMKTLLKACTNLQVASLHLVLPDDSDRQKWCDLSVIDEAENIPQMELMMDFGFQELYAESMEDQKEKGEYRERLCIEFIHGTRRTSKYGPGGDLW